MGPRRRTSNLATVDSDPYKPFRRIGQAACGVCRLRKAKCDEQRPACGYCASKNLTCEYDTARGETRTNARKRLIESLRDENAGLLDENAALQQQNKELLQRRQYSR